MINNNNNNNNNNNRVNTSHKSEVNILWNQQVRNDRTVPNNKQDIIIHDNEIGICMLIDVAIPGDRNVIKKEAEKIFKCKDLLIEINRTWNMKAKLIPVIIDTDNTWKTYQESMKLRIYKKQPYWARHTSYGKYSCESTKHISRAK